MKYDFVPQWEGKKIHKDVVYEKEKYPEDLTEDDRIKCGACNAAAYARLPGCH